MPRYKLHIITNPMITPQKLLDIVTKTATTIQESGGVVLDLLNQGIQPVAYPFEDRCVSCS
jgi:ribosomal protein S6